jgi:hypothetical protein
MEEFKCSQPGNFETGKLSDFYLFVLLMSLRSVLKSSFLDFQKEQLNPLLIENDDGETVFNDSITTEDKEAIFETIKEYKKFGFAFQTQKEYQETIHNLSYGPAFFEYIELITNKCIIFLLTYLENIDSESDRDCIREYFVNATNQQLRYLYELNDINLLKFDEYEFYEAYTPIKLQDPDIQDTAPLTVNFNRIQAISFYKSILASLENQE